MSPPSNPSILIVGTGFGGLCMAAKLKQAGNNDFIVLEKAESLGGTWRENRYPGAECDVGSNLYSYSFFPNPDWDHRWAKQTQILGYQNKFADAFDLRPHMQFGKAVSEAVYDEESRVWKVKTADGTDYTAQKVILALGQLHNINIPDFEGRADFKGAQFHTADWPDGLDLTGKNIGIIGNAASAVQAIPKLADMASHLTIYQRSANWMLPKNDRPFFKIEKWLARHVPGVLKLNRLGWFCLGEFFLFPMIQGKGRRSKIGEAAASWNMKRHIKDPEMRAKLTPDYPIGAKRVLIADGYYETLAREDVTVEFNGVKALNAQGIETPGGASYPHDVIVYATGFKTDPFYQNFAIKGEGGKALSDHWAAGAKAYHGVMTTGFPNLFMLYGPNTNTGHTSIIFKLENQVGYVMKILERAKEKTVSVKAQAEQDFDDEMQTRLKETAWAKVETSWYKQKSGRIANNWPGSGIEYKRRMKTPIWDDYIIN